VVCNTWLKFGQLWAFGRQLGADFIATGHYAQVKPGPGGFELHKGIDSDKDQSYVLHGIGREVLAHLLFPVGGYTKGDIRSIAREAGLLGVADKPDSVEICFVPGGDHTEVVRSRRPEVAMAGVIQEKDGTVLGDHDGIDRFTIGQRKGLGVAAGRKRFVLEILPETNTVVVGDHDDLLAAGLVASGVNWLADPPVGAAALCREDPLPSRGSPGDGDDHPRRRCDRAIRRARSQRSPRGRPWRSTTAPASSAGGGSRGRKHQLSAIRSATRRIDREVAGMATIKSIELSGWKSIKHAKVDSARSTS
jgi:hypothetical protein